MMKDGIHVNQRDIVLTSFPYTSLSQIKKRPAMVISNQNYNSSNEDVICCALTSNLANYSGSVKIDSRDLEFGNLLYKSLIKPDKVFTLGKELILKKLARLNKSKSKKVIKNLNKLVKIK